jgi:putative hydrolase of the HAD superfamily
MHALLSDLGVEEFFATVVISGDIGINKPDARIFHLALQKTGLQPEGAVYVGDTEEDIAGSLTAGIGPILIQRDQFHKKNSELDFIAGDQSTQTQSVAKI